MKSWKTTVGGIVTALGMALTSSTDPTTHNIGIVLSSVGALFTGLAARDNNKSSEDVGIK